MTKRKLKGKIRSNLAGKFIHFNATKRKKEKKTLQILLSKAHLTECMYSIVYHILCIMGCVCAYRLMSYDHTQFKRCVLYFTLNKNIDGPQTDLRITLIWRHQFRLEYYGFADFFLLFIQMR